MVWSVKHCIQSVWFQRDHIFSLRKLWKRYYEEQLKHDSRVNSPAIKNFFFLLNVLETWQIAKTTFKLYAPL